jgi:serine/threonine protein kinase
MRFEAGGGLDSLMYKSGVELTMVEKIRILTQIARGLAELHAVDIIHGDIKPANILLSHHVPPKIRIADFGFAHVRENPGGGSRSGGGGSTMYETSSFKGTPIYSAPEKIVNPFLPVKQDTVAKSSRLSDVYAFAIMSWEVLCQERPFAHITSEAILCSVVHQGERPPLEYLPKETPPALKAMIAACWDGDRAKRRKAIECYSLLNYISELSAGRRFDVFLSHSGDPVTTHLLTYVFHYFEQRRYHVCFSARTPGEAVPEEDAGSMAGSRLTLACVDRTYQSSAACLQELREARASRRQVVTLCLEPEFDFWMGSELQTLVRPTSASFYDIGRLCRIVSPATAELFGVVCVV